MTIKGWSGVINSYYLQCFSAFFIAVGYFIYTFFWEMHFIRRGLDSMAPLMDRHFGNSFWFVQKGCYRAQFLSHKVNFMGSYPKSPGIIHRTDYPTMCNQKVTESFRSRKKGSKAGLNRQRLVRQKEEEDLFKKVRMFISKTLYKSYEDRILLWKLKLFKQWSLINYRLYQKTIVRRCTNMFTCFTNSIK